jgi:hypothetical protein
MDQKRWDYNQEETDRDRFVRLEAFKYAVGDLRSYISNYGRFEGK